MLTALICASILSAPAGHRSPSAERIRQLSLGMTVAEVKTILRIDEDPVSEVPEWIELFADAKMRTELIELFGRLQYEFQESGTRVLFSGSGRITTLIFTAPGLTIMGFAAGQPVENLIAARGLPSRLDLNSKGLIYNDPLGRVSFIPDASGNIKEIQVGAVHPVSYWAPARGGSPR